LTGEKTAPRTLTDYVRAKRRKACPVCSLSDDLREQMKRARAQKIPQDDVRAWLKEDYGIELARSDFTSHGAAHHDQQED
jgi:hypothetical protein